MTRSRLDVDRAAQFCRKQFLWLRQVVSDPTLPPMAAKVAIALTRYFNRETGVAYPAHDTLAAELGVSDRTIRATISTMIEAATLVSSGTGSVAVAGPTDTAC